MAKALTAAINADYQKLLADIRGEMGRGLDRIEELIERQKVLSSWNIGRRISTYLNAHEMPRGAIGPFYEGLAKDLASNYRTLQQCEQFYRYFPKLKPHKCVKLSHYRYLLTVNDEAQRQRWLERIIKDRIPTYELRLKLSPPKSKEEGEHLKLKEPVRGRLYTYSLLRADDVENFDEPWFVDVGFAVRHEAPPSKGALNYKYIYTSEKSTDGYRLKAVHCLAEELYTFRGKCRRVIDGDTLLVLIDQGFGIWNEQRLRLFGIDAPELNTIAGARAKKWLEHELKSCRNIVVKTYKSDKWDRYLVDVFYLPQEVDLHRIAADGLWLNQRMVEAGVAKVWKAE